MNKNQYINKIQITKSMCSDISYPELEVIFLLYFLLKIIFLLQNSFDSNNLNDNNLMNDSFLYPRMSNLNEAIDERTSLSPIYNAFDIKENTENLLDDFELNKLFCQNEEKYQKDIIINKFTKICKWEDIKNYITIDNGFSEDIIHIINECNISNQYYDSLNIFYINKKRKRNIESINTNTTLTLKPLGRIKDEDKKNGKCGKHTKDDPDNIIKKCKRILISYAIAHINKIIEKEKKYELLLHLKYSYINNIKKDSDLELLNTKIKDIVSKDISEKYKSKDEKWNKNIIDKIILEDANNDKLINLLNMTFNEWIDAFTYKTKNEYNKDINLLQSALDKINKKNNQNKEYLSKLIFYLYNYKRWFESKKGRNTEEKNDVEKNDENEENEE